jgi:hypothetical protein
MKQKKANAFMFGLALLTLMSFFSCKPVTGSGGAGTETEVPEKKFAPDEVAVKIAAFLENQTLVKGSDITTGLTVLKIGDKGGCEEVDFVGYTDVIAAAPAEDDEDAEGTVNAEEEAARGYLVSPKNPTGSVGKNLTLTVMLEGKVNCQPVLLSYNVVASENELPDVRELYVIPNKSNYEISEPVMLTGIVIYSDDTQGVIVDSGKFDSTNPKELKTLTATEGTGKEVGATYKTVYGASRINVYKAGEAPPEAKIQGIDVYTTKSIWELNEIYSEFVELRNGDGSHSWLPYGYRIDPVNPTAELGRKTITTTYETDGSKFTDTTAITVVKVGSGPGGGTGDPDEPEGPAAPGGDTTENKIISLVASFKYTWKLNEDFVPQVAVMWASGKVQSLGAEDYTVSWYDTETFIKGTGSPTSSIGLKDVEITYNNMENTINNIQLTTPLLLIEVVPSRILDRIVAWPKSSKSVGDDITTGDFFVQAIWSDQSSRTVGDYEHITITPSGKTASATAGTKKITVSYTDVDNGPAVTQYNDCNLVISGGVGDDPPQFPIPVDGFYFIELWGAQGQDVQGGTASSKETAGGTAYGGKGAYVSAILKFSEGELLKVTIGGNTPAAVGGSGSDGGAGGSDPTLFGAGCGGGATDIRFIGTTLEHRILVAAGGGGACDGTVTPETEIRGKSYLYNGGYGGALTGGSGTGHPLAFGTGGSQTAGGLGGTPGGGNGVWGKGGTFGQAPLRSPMAGGQSESVGGGGGGYYGGGSGGHQSQNGTGGGGSSYIDGFDGCVAKDKTTNAAGRTILTPMIADGVTYQTRMIAGNAEMPRPDGGKETGHSGIGAWKITYIPAGVAN